MKRKSEKNSGLKGIPFKPEFFPASFSQLLKLRTNCEYLSSIKYTICCNQATIVNDYSSSFNDGSNNTKYHGGRYGGSFLLENIAFEYGRSVHDTVHTKGFRDLPYPKPPDGR